MSSLLTSTQKIYPASLVLNFDGANNGTVFIDNSQYGHTVTGYNGAIISTSQSKFNGSSAYFDGSSYYLGIDTNNVFAMGLEDFTVECWVYPTNWPTSDLGAIVEGRTDSSSGGFLLWLGSDYKWILYTSADSNGTQRVISSTANAVLNTWTHLAGTRKNGILYLYVNGFLVGSTGTEGSPDDLSPSNTAPILIGTACDSPGGSRMFHGYIDEVRVTKGVALYEGIQFIVPNKATNRNSVKVPQAQNHIVIVSTKSSGNVSGIVTTSTGHYTVKWWDGTQTIYASGETFSKVAVAGDKYITIYPSTSTGILNGYFHNANLSNNSISSVRALHCKFIIGLGTQNPGYNQYTWYCYTQYNCWSRFYAYVPGSYVSGPTYTLDVSSNNLTSSALNDLYTDLLPANGTIEVSDNTGSDSDDPSIATNKGYTVFGSIAPYTLLLLNCNGSNNSTTFTDSSPSPKTVTRTNTVISTTQSKFGGASAYFSNSGSDALAVTENFNLSEYDYTIEFFFYLINQNGATDNSRLFSLEKSGESWGVLLVQSTPNFASYNLYGTGTSIDLNNTSFSYATWYHFAMTKDYDTYRFFLNGNLIGSDTGNYTPTGDIVLTIGGSRLQYNYNKLNAYIDDFRVINGKALYTSNFTAPSSQLVVYP